LPTLLNSSIVIIISIIIRDKSRDYSKYDALCRGQVSGKYTFRVENSTELILVVPVINSGEDAHQTVLTVDLPDSIDYIETISQVVYKASVRSTHSYARAQYLH